MTDEAYDRAKHAVLIDAVEDYTGLWTVWFEADAALPGAPVAERLALAERVVRDLLNEGLVAMFRCTAHFRECVLVEEREVEGVLRDHLSWVVPVGAAGQDVYVFATEKGVAKAGFGKPGESS